MVVWRVRWPGSFSRWVGRPVLSKWRRWHYHRHWPAVMTIARLAPQHRGRILVPVLGKVTSTGCTDLAAVKLVSGQSPADFANRADHLAHGFGACLCRVRTARPGWITLELVRRDALAAIIPALPVPAGADLRALPVGRREDGTAVDCPAARHPPAHRRSHRRRERLDHLGPDPRPARPDARRAGPRPGR